MSEEKNKKKLILFYLSISEYKYPDYVLISKDTSGSTSQGGNDYSQNDINDFIDWIESTYSGVTVHDDNGEGFSDELWVEEMMRHIDMYYDWR